MDLADFQYPLPPELIAQTPAPRRDASRLLVVDRASDRLDDRRFAELPALLRPGDCLVVNDSRVIPARVLARDAGARAVELLFVEPVEAEAWRAMVRPGRRARAGARLTVGDSTLRIAAVDDDGTRVVEPVAPATIPALMARHGVPPLPPYIARHAAPAPDDTDRYQTIYAEPPGSIAAPTAGLHFTADVLTALSARDIEVHRLTLHVGPATFRPIRAERVEDHKLPAERVTISSAVATAVNTARAQGRRVVAVGTTTVRALEGAAGGDGRVEPLAGAVDLYITPGYGFRVVDALLTNFHLPGSSLLVLVSALAGRERVLGAYRHAVERRYRFYSYGDATLIL